MQARPSLPHAPCPPSSGLPCPGYGLFSSGRTCLLLFRRHRCTATTPHPQAVSLWCCIVRRPARPSRSCLAPRAQVPPPLLLRRQPERDGAAGVRPAPDLPAAQPGLQAPGDARGRRWVQNLSGLEATGGARCWGQGALLSQVSPLSQCSQSAAASGLRLCKLVCSCASWFAAHRPVPASHPPAQLPALLPPRPLPLPLPGHNAGAGASSPEYQRVARLIARLQALRGAPLWARQEPSLAQPYVSSAADVTAFVQTGARASCAAPCGVCLRFGGAAVCRARGQRARLLSTS